MASKPTPAIVDKAIKDFDSDNRAHEQLVTEYDRRYRAYRGVLEKRSESASWTNKQHPAFIFQSVETMVASLVDASPKWRLRAQPQMGSPEEIARMAQGAKANELLLNHQLANDHFAESQRTVDLQALITGLTATKQRWLFEKGNVRQLINDVELVQDDWGNIIEVPILKEGVSYETLRDDPTSEPVDVRDLIIGPESAISLQKADRITHRLWYTFDELKRLEKSGFFEGVDELKESKDFSSSAADRENDLFKVSRSKDKIEVLEQWRRNPSLPGGIEVLWIANRKVLLRHEKQNPFWFDRLDHPFPFAVFSPTSDLFRIPGISEVEVMAEIQEMLWTMINQRLDNLQLLNNAIILIASDVDDPDSFDFAPGERWLVDRPDQVKSLELNPMPANLSLQAEQVALGQLQNITGGMPFLSGSESQSVDQQTATGVSIVTSLAQKRLAAKRQQIIWGKRRIGEQWCALNQQFIRGKRAVPVIGTQGAQAFVEITPDVLKGTFAFEAELADDSMIRQERRAEAQAKLQTAAQVQGVMVAGGTPLNMPAFVEDYLESFDIDDKAKYFMPMPNQAQQGQPPQGPPPGQPGQPPGATAPQAIDANSPSNAFSQSPVAAMQRMGAMSGPTQ